jgi:SET domain-containing protein
MMMIETELRPSKIHGIGVFLIEPVKEGQLIWRFDSRIDRVYSQAELGSLPPLMQRYLRVYSTWHEGLQLWVLCGDNGRHFNHSDAPNTVSDGVGFGDDVAARDLPAGTELTTDYTTICDAFRSNGMTFEHPGVSAKQPQLLDA